MISGNRPDKSGQVLLINSNREISPNPVLPIGMALVASSLAEQGFNVACADLGFKRSWQKHLQEKLKQSQPDYIGISIRNIDNHDRISPRLYLDEVKDIIELCRRHSPAKIFCGGAALAVMPELILRYLGLEAGVFGDGEETTPKLLRRWENSEDLSNLPGIVYQKGGNIFLNPPQRIEPLSALPPTDLARWIDIKPYFRQEASYPVQAKRGCPFDCIYCTYAKGEGKTYRFRPAFQIVQEIIDIHERHRPKTIEFVDSIFNHPPGFAESICRELIKRGSRAKLHTIELSPEFLSPELIALMEKAGFVSCGLTCESASETILKNLKKSYGAEAVRRAARNLRHSKMKKLWIFLLGGPGENEGTIEETLDFIREELGENDIVFFNIGIRIYPGTEMEAIARREGQLDESANLLFPTFYVSPKISLPAIEARLKAERNHNIVTIKDLRFPLLPALLKTAGFIRLKNPYWSYAPIFNRVKEALWLK